MCNAQNRWYGESDYRAGDEAGECPCHRLSGSAAGVKEWFP